jgi:hypothetical protein
MPWFYTTVTEVKERRVAIEAEDAAAAEVEALEQYQIHGSDYNLVPHIEVEEIKRHVE